MTEGEQNICFRGVVVAVADKYALRVNAGLPLAGEGKISRGVAQPPGEGLCQLAAGVDSAVQQIHGGFSGTVTGKVQFQNSRDIVDPRHFDGRAVVQDDHGIRLYRSDCGDQMILISGMARVVRS